MAPVRADAVSMCIARALAIVLLALVLAGCLGDPEQLTAELHDSARSLVPSGAKAIDQEDGACVTLAEYPSCTMIAFFVEGSLEERERLVEEAAHRGGWERRDVLHGEGGTGLAFDRGDFRGHVALWPDPRSTCDGRPLNECSSQVDHVQVIRGLADP